MRLRSVVKNRIGTRLNSLKGKKALVTGGASGIGKAISEELAERGADILVHYHSSSDSANQLVNMFRKNGTDAIAFKADLTVESEVKSLISEIKTAFGGLDILINNLRPIRAIHWSEG